MTYNKLIFLFIFFLSCQSKEKNVPTITTNLDLNWEDIDLNNGIEFENTFLKSTFGSFNKLKMICQIISPEIDSTTLREYDLFMMEGISKTKNQKILATVSQNNELIDYIIFDDKKWKLQYIYTHSSEIEHDGVAVEFIEDKTKGKNISIYRNSYEILQTGEFQKLQPKFDGLEVFEKLESTKMHTGKYEYYQNDIYLKLELKDGIINNTYAFKFNFNTPRGCTQVAHNLKREFKFNGKDSISHFQVIFDNNKIQLVNEEFETECKEELKINVELNSTNTTQ